MPCPNCDHTMLNVGGDGLVRVYWCPRCGTHKKTTQQLARDGHGGQSVADLHEECLTPMLVDRVRRFTNTLGMMWTRLAHRLGIFESIYPPADRPPNEPQVMTNDELGSIGIPGETGLGNIGDKPQGSP